MKNGQAAEPAAARNPAAWPAFAAEKRDIGALKPFARNARLHSPDQVAEIAASISEWGWTMPVLIDEQDGILAGHARVLAAQLLGLAEVPVVVARDWTDEQKRAYVLADNKLGLNATWDDKLLALEVNDLKSLGFNLALAGFGRDDMTALDDMLTEDEAANVVQSNGSLLALVDITLKEPTHKVEPHDTWKVGPHVLHCCSVLTGWSTWAPSLKGDAVFCPFPGVFVPLSDKAAESRLVMVQPDAYIAGHILDRYAEVHGKRSVKRTGQGTPS